MSYTVTVDNYNFTVGFTPVNYTATMSLVGQQGQAGANGASLNYQGTWLSGTAYVVDDLVTNDGSTYACILNHTASATDEPGVGANTATYWEVFVAAGTDGTNGTNGTDGLGFTGGSYNAATGVVTFTSDDGLGFSTSDLRGADGVDGTNGTDGLGFTGGSYNVTTGVVTFTSDDGLGFSTGDLRGANGNDGLDGISFVWESSWVLSTAYQANDVVYNNGSSYICILDHTSSATDAPGVGVNTATYWEVMALKGVDGVGAGTVTSVDITGGTGITSTGGPVTSSGSITVALDTATQTSLGLADSALQSSDIGVSVQGYSAVLQNTTASYTTAEETKLAGIEAGATADQTGAEIKTALFAEADTNNLTDALLSKLNGIEAGADVTDTANVTAAGALMDSEVDADIKTLTLPANTTISTFGASLIDDADAATARTTLGLGIGTDVLAYDANLQGFVTAFTLPTTDGTADQVLKTDGAGNIGFATAGGGGGLVPISKTTASASAAVDIALTGGYTKYLIKIDDLLPATDGDLLYCRVSTDGGSTFLTSGYGYAYGYRDVNGTGTQGLYSSGKYAASDSKIDLAPLTGNATGEGLSMTNEIWTGVDSVSKFSMHGFHLSFSTAGRAQPGRHQGWTTSVGAVDTIRFYLAFGNITSGDFHLYGIADGA